MALVHRVLYPQPILSLDEFLTRGGGKGLKAASQVEPQALIETVAASGLRGRGGAGFPTGLKWRTVSENRLPGVPSTVIVNAAEGEPGTLKDRAILRRNPYVVVEGALIAAKAVGADLVIFAMKRSFGGEVDRVQGAVDEAHMAGWTNGTEIVVFEGPDEYLYGEESALLDTIDGGWPFPRIVPTFRRGIGASKAAVAQMDPDAPVGPALVNNTETLANVARIVARGPEWFRTMGTEESPGTMVCTITGHTRNHGVGEVQMGTPLREVIEEIGGGPRPGRTIKAVVSGVANGIIPGDLLDTPVTYEALRAIGSGVGSGGFIVAEMLPKISRSEGAKNDLLVIGKRLSTVADRARCFLGSQQQVVVGSIIEHFQAEFDDHVAGRRAAVEPELIAELVDIRGGHAIWDERHRQKQPDWTYNKTDSGTVPVEMYAGVIPHWGS